MRQKRARQWLGHYRFRSGVLPAKKNKILIATLLLCIFLAVVDVAHIFVHTISNEHGMT